MSLKFSGLPFWQQFMLILRHQFMRLKALVEIEYKLNSTTKNSIDDADNIRKKIINTIC